MIGKSIFVAVTAIAVPYILTRFAIDPRDDVLTDEARVSQVWDSQITQPERAFSKILVGLNSNVDVIARGSGVFGKLNVSPSSSSRDHSVINSLEQLEEAFSHFFARGLAAERPYGDGGSFRTLVDGAARTSDVEWFVGGNAALIAQKMVSSFPGTEVRLVGPIGPKLQSLLNSRINIPSISKVDQDEVHVILEYQVNEQWGTSTAPIATRFITSHDVQNSQLTMLDAFFSTLNEFRPELVVFSGLHMLDGQPEAFWAERLDRLKSHLTNLGPDTPVHLELASMTNANFMKRVLQDIIPNVASVGFNEQELTSFVRLLTPDKHSIVPRVNSLGLNEQELAFTSQSGGGPHIETSHELVDGQPDISRMGDMILWLLQQYGSGRKSSRLSRIHFHSLTYHVIGVVRGSWANAGSSVAAGTKVAGQQACDTAVIEPSRVRLRVPKTLKLFTSDTVRTFNPDSPIVSASIGPYDLFFSPVLVCMKPLKTVGLGDAISATGLMYSHYLHLST